MVGHTTSSELSVVPYTIAIVRKTPSAPLLNRSACRNDTFICYDTITQSEGGVHMVKQILTLLKSKDWESIPVVPPGALPPPVMAYVEDRTRRYAWPINAR